MVKNLPAMQETWVQSLGLAWQPTLVFLLGESHGQSNVEGYSPWGRKQSDMTEPLTHTHTHTHALCYNFPDSNMRWRHYITKTHATALAYDSRSLEFLLSFHLGGKQQQQKTHHLNVDP